MEEKIRMYAKLLENPGAFRCRDAKIQGERQKLGKILTFKVLANSSIGATKDKGNLTVKLINPDIPLLLEDSSTFRRFLYFP